MSSEVLIVFLKLQRDPTNRKSLELKCDIFSAIFIINVIPGVIAIEDIHDIPEGHQVRLLEVEALEDHDIEADIFLHTAVVPILALEGKPVAGVMIVMLGSVRPPAHIASAETDLKLI